MLKPAGVKELPTEQKLFGKAWAILKAYRNIDAWGSEWAELLDKVGELRKDGKGSPETEILAEGLAIILLRYLDASARARVK